jgi:hypothetical protein
MTTLALMAHQHTQPQSHLLQLQPHHQQLSQQMQLLHPPQHHMLQLQHEQQHGQPQQQRSAGRRRGGSGAVKRNEEKVRRTVYISDIADTVTESQLARFFQDCGQVVDCRVCGDPNSSMRFAFIEFQQEQGAQQARSLGIN